MSVHITSPVKLIEIYFVYVLTYVRINFIFASATYVFKYFVRSGAVTFISRVETRDVNTYSNIGDSALFIFQD